MCIRDRFTPGDSSSPLSLVNTFASTTIPYSCLLYTSYIITEIRRDQSQSLKRYCSTTLDNIEINIASMATSMKKTSTMFSSKQETQSYLQSASRDTHQLQRQSFSDLIGMSQMCIRDTICATALTNPLMGSAANTAY